MKRSMRFRVMLGLSLMALVLGGFLAQPPARAAAQGEQDVFMYLPVANNMTANSITGVVTYLGQPAPYVRVELQMRDEGTSVRVGEQLTDYNGRYTFTNLELGSYRVFFFNNGSQAQQIYLSYYGTGTVVMNAGGPTSVYPFDIADIERISPAPEGSVTLPATFQWKRRLVTDVYAFNLLDDPSMPTLDYTDDEHPVTKPENPGSTMQYVLSALPQGFVVDNTAPYYWGVAVGGPDGGIGYSLVDQVSIVSTAPGAPPAFGLRAGTMKLVRVPPLE